MTTTGTTTTDTTTTTTTRAKPGLIALVNMNDGTPWMTLTAPTKRDLKAQLCAYPKARVELLVRGRVLPVATRALHIF